MGNYTTATEEFTTTTRRNEWIVNTTKSARLMDVLEALEAATTAYGRTGLGDLSEDMHVVTDGEDIVIYFDQVGETVPVRDKGNTDYFFDGNQHIIEVGDIVFFPECNRSGKRIIHLLHGLNGDDYALLQDDTRHYRTNELIKSI